MAERDAYGGPLDNRMACQESKKVVYNMNIIHRVVLKPSKSGSLERGPDTPDGIVDTYKTIHKVLAASCHLFAGLHRLLSTPYTSACWLVVTATVHSAVFRRKAEYSNEAAYFECSRWMQ
jgi:hypothetical protein